MNAKHTPGPWTIHEDPDNPGYFTIYPEHGHPIGDAGAYFHAADASLVSAAPDLLEALEFVMDRLVDRHECDVAAVQARAAIAKARGKA